MTLDALREEVLEANLELVRRGLVLYTFGNASGPRFHGVDPLSRPAVLVAGHAPFTWGETVAAAAHTAVVLEEVAQMALSTLAVNPNASPISQAMLDKHFYRKHGRNAYYG